MNEFTEKLIHGRVHVSPKRLANPGPDPSQKNQILLAANAAPDHGRMMPWRFIEIGQGSRDALGEAFYQCLLDRDQSASPIQLQEAREKALRGPLLLLAIANYEDATNEISKEEKLVSLGCAIQNILLSAYALGFGSGLSSGKALQSPRLRNLFNLADHEDPICFITIGTVTQNKLGRIRPSVSDYHSFF